MSWAKIKFLFVLSAGLKCYILEFKAGHKGSFEFYLAQRLAQSACMLQWARLVFEQNKHDTVE